MMELRTPRNFKNGRYIFSRYRLIDLFIMITGLMVSLGLSILVLSHRKINIMLLILSILPGLIAFILTFNLKQVSFNLFELSKSSVAYLKRDKDLEWEGHYYEQTATKESN